YSGIRDDSQDLAAEVRLRFLEKGGQIRKAKNVKAWMYRALDSLTADRGREADKRFELVGGIREQIRDEFAEAGLRVGNVRRDESTDDEPSERDDRTVVLTKSERREGDAEIEDRQDNNPYYQPDDDDLERADDKAASALL